jgi:MoaA/NifB/PqqE/SkfB family radical SAM enzyme
MAHRIADAFDEVRVSVDGPKDTNDQIRGNGAFDAAMRAIRNLEEAGLYPSVSITITSQNISHLQSFLLFLLREKFITDFHLSPFRPVGRGVNVKDLEYPWRKAQSVLADFWREQFGVSHKLKKPEAYTPASCRNCGIGSYINIHPNGNVYPCHVLSVSDFLLGNIRTRPLTRICQESILLKTLRSLDFDEKVGVSGRLKNLLENAICLGEVYRDAREELMELLNHKSK